MLKNMYLLITITTLSFASTTASVDKINIIKGSLAHITQAKKDIFAEREIAISINKQMLAALREKADIGHLMDFYAYEICMEKIQSILNAITSRDDFKHVLDHVTDFQITCIVDKHIHFDDIAYTPESYPLEQKALVQAINAAIKLEELPSCKNSELHFNVYYMQATQHLGYELLLKKLNHKEQELKAELAALEGIHTWPTKLFIDKLKSILLLLK